MAPAFLLKNLPARKDLQELTRRYPGIDVDATETYMALLGLANDILTASDLAMARHKISQGRMRVLMQLIRHPAKSMTPCELSERIGVTRATITGLLDGLERDRFIRREQSPRDRRSVAIQLLPKGERFLNMLMPERFRRIAALMRHLSRQDQAALRRLLSKISLGLPAFHKR